MSDLVPGTRVRMNDSCVWPERRGCTGIVVAPPSGGTYPQPPRWEVVVLLDDDPLSEPTETGNCRWSCCTSRKSLDIDPPVEGNQVAKLTQYPFPLADGSHAYLHLPRTITRADAERLKQAIDALVVDESDVIQAMGAEQ